MSITRRVLSLPQEQEQGPGAPLPDVPLQDLAVSTTVSKPPVTTTLAPTLGALTATAPLVNTTTTIATTLTTTKLTATNSAVVSSSSIVSPTVVASNASAGSTPSLGLIIGIALGALAVIAVIVTVLICRRAKGRRRRDKQRAIITYLTGSNSSHSDNHINNNYSGESSLGTVMVDQSRQRAFQGHAGPTRMLDNGYPQYNQQFDRRRTQQPSQEELQPEWWIRKSPLEYYQQTPPIERSTGGEYPWQQAEDPAQEYEAMAENSALAPIQDPNMMSGPSRWQTRDQNAYSMDRPKTVLSFRGPLDLQRQHYSLPPKRPSMYQKQDLQMPLDGVMTVLNRSLSPTRSLTPTNPLYNQDFDPSRPESVYIPPPPFQRSFTPTSWYPPPPPVLPPSVAFSASVAMPLPLPPARAPSNPRDQQHQPPSGFYDFFEPDELDEAPAPPRPIISRPVDRSLTSTPSPPPIPRATRPAETKDTTMIAISSGTSAQSSPTLLVDNVYAAANEVPGGQPKQISHPDQTTMMVKLRSQPELDVVGPRPQIRSPLATLSLSSNSLAAMLEKDINEPRMGGRMPRIPRGK
ncbi:hypothetical protein BGZ99_004937 [Dissophora globulifera]|uniref:Uncharacterized protein n=1 Tax=Dissophora globulifera TaxID=979702 RepID=A0A9P6RLA4_9FUNG|nr:hypothetical protein BGZ99_004937 [Dissophora globulifera]